MSDPTEHTGFARIWADLARAGWREGVVRYVGHAVWLGVLALALWGRQINFAHLNALGDKLTITVSVGDPLTASPVPLPTPDPVLETVLVPPLVETVEDASAVRRRVETRTYARAGGRAQVITYTVQAGDTLFGIADKYGLKPETILWSNYYALKDDPHLLLPGQVLNILPVDGLYYYVNAGDTLEKIARTYQVEPDAIVAFPGNNLDSERPAARPGTYLVIPGGQRELQVWVVPTITREQKSSAANNFGQCPGGYSGAIGSGAFAWPADTHFLSGYDYTAIHKGLDIKAPLGASIYATDGGVVVYAGWNDYGYGNLVVIDHGNGWQSIYAHLSQWNVSCGQSVGQASVIGLSGNTGRASGAHLHFELRLNGAHVNPWTVLP
jgi:murein DD-endopeptidase MepM/ murein hydrolase activator NlpD